MNGSAEMSLSGLAKGSHIHFMGICGTAMASLAGIIKELGYHVTGSDQNVYPPMSTQLEELGVSIMEGYEAKNLSPRPDFVIVGNVISRHFPEAEALIEMGIPYTSLPKALGEVAIANRRSYVVAGTHGKTTTTAILAQCLSGLGEDPGFLIGGIPLNFQKSFRAPEAETFVIEGDEYDSAFFDKVPKFIHYRPRFVILTSIEFDHADIYRDLDHVKEAFVELLRKIPEDGLLVYRAEDQNIASILSEAKCRKVSYGLVGADYQAGARANFAGRNQFQVKWGENHFSDLALKVFGEHNSLNATGAYALLNELRKADFSNWSHSELLQSLSEFKGVKRRQEIIFDEKGRTIVEDFAHHPSAVQLTIDCMREQFPGRRVLAVFEPRSATARRKVFQSDFGSALAKADQVFLAEPFHQEKIPEEQRFSADEVKDQIEKLGGAIELGADSGELARKIIQNSKPGDVVLVMSNGGFDGIYGKLIDGFCKSSVTPDLEH